MLPDFKEVWAVDFEYRGQAGECPSPVCFVARELRSNRLIRLWQDELHALDKSPIPTTPDTLLVAYYASAEVACYLALGWPVPTRILDLFVEFRCLRSGLPTRFGRGLIGALAHHGLPSILAAEKDSMRSLVLRGEPYSADDRAAILDYCQSDVDALAKLLPVMMPSIDLPRATYRGRYMAAVARMERTGIPIDTERLELLRRRWDGIKYQLVGEIDRRYGVYAGLTFKAKHWLAWLELNGIPWPMTPSGWPALDAETFEDMARIYPAVAPIGDLLATLGSMRLHELPVGADGRNRCMLSAFSAKTSRNQPSTTKFVFGLPAWLRSLVRPAPGMAVAYLDWSQQELAIAAVLSGDRRMQEAYLSGDFYLTFGQMAGAIPAGATKTSHGRERDQFKTVALGVLYGLSEWGLARKLTDPARGRDLLQMHRETFRQFWRWSDAVQDTAMLTGHLQTVFGWPVHVAANANPRSLRNFPMQAHGAEMLRLACCEATERGIAVCAPVHDAVLIEAPAADIDAAVAEMQGIMARAGGVVLDGFPIRSEAKVVRHPDRYRDARDEDTRMWERVSRLCGVSP